MSYILDALKKAAEQRDVHAPAMRRLFSEDPEVAELPRWRMALLGGGAAFAGAALVTAFWLLWPSATVVTERLEATPATAFAQPEATRVAVPPPPPAPPIVRTAPRPPSATSATADTRPPAPATETRRARDTAPVTEARRAPAEPASPAEVRRPAVEPAPPAEVRRPAVEPPPASEARRPAAEPAPARPPSTAGPAGVIAAVRPVTPPAPGPGAAVAPRSDAGASMRLEVIVYSEERGRRLAFINGRKYVEGDTLLDGARIQEIQPNAVVIIEDGRRTVLRP